jgi:polyisoprenoid-binding protein YceI
MAMNTNDLRTMVPALLIGLSAGCSDPSKDVHRTTGADPRQVAGNTSAAGTEYVIRAGSTIGFVGSKVTGSHTGGFTNLAGALRVADGKILSDSEIQIALGSTWSDSDRLTGHLKSPDFFDVENHPMATSTVTGVEGSGNQQTVTGNLDLHGVTRSISFPAKVQVAAEFAINRKDFNISYPGKPDDLIRDNVVIKLDVRATPGPARPEDLLPRS